MRIDNFVRHVVVDDDTAALLEADHAIDHGRLVATREITNLIRERARRARNKASRMVGLHGMREALMVDQSGTVLGKAVAHD